MNLTLKCLQLVADVGDDELWSGGSGCDTYGGELGEDFGVKFVGGFDVEGGAAVGFGEFDEFAGVGGVPTSDDDDGFGTLFDEVFEATKDGGGIGLYAGDVRASGSRVKSTATGTAHG